MAETLPSKELKAESFFFKLKIKNKNDNDFVYKLDNYIVVIGVERLTLRVIAFVCELD